jgi:hypothetical protein
MSDTTAAHEPEIRIHIDRQPYIVHKHDLTGTELRNLPHPPIAENFDLWREEHGDVEDQPVSPGETIHLKEDMHFYSSPNNINPGAC